MDLNEQAFLESLIEKYKVSPNKVQLVIDKVKPIIISWAAEYLDSIDIMGSWSNRTNINKGLDQDLDVDLLIRLKSDTPYDLKYLYESLHKKLIEKKIDVELRNISMRFQVGNMKVDLVPAINEKGNTGYNRVYSRKLDEERPSNTDYHIELVKQSGLIPELKLLKIWAASNDLKFDGFYSNLVGMEALRASTPGELGPNMLTMLKYIRDRLMTTIFVDPSYNKSIISDNMETKEKQALVDLAIRSLAKDDWNSVFNERQ